MIELHNPKRNVDIILKIRDNGQTSAVGGLILSSVVLAFSAALISLTR